MKKPYLGCTYGRYLKPSHSFHPSMIALFIFICKIFEPWFKFLMKRCHCANKIVSNLDCLRWLIPKIKNILHSPIAPPSKAPMNFEFAKEEMCHNSGILKSFDHNTEFLIQDFPHSCLSCGNEFHQTSIMEPLL